MGRIHDGAIGITHGDWYGGEDFVDDRGIDGHEMTSRAGVTDDGKNGKKSGRTFHGRGYDTCRKTCVVLSGRLPSFLGVSSSRAVACHDTGATTLQVEKRGVINVSRRLVVACRRAMIRVRTQTMGPAVVPLGSVGHDVEIESEAKRDFLVIKKKGACRVCDACWKRGFLGGKETDAC
jgi:hypothetical protein